MTAIVSTRQKKSGNKSRPSQQCAALLQTEAPEILPTFIQPISLPRLTAPIICPVRLPVLLRAAYVKDKLPHL